jgi:protein gp37
MKSGDHRWTGKMALIESQLLLPLRWKRPRRIFVNSTSDLFHEKLPDEAIDRVFAIMALCPQHTFQVLTKRPERMRQWFAEQWQPAPAQVIEYPDLPRIELPAETKGEDRESQIDAVLDEMVGELGLADPDNDAHWTPDGQCKARQFSWPLPNVWLGTSVEDQERADERIPHLLATPAAVRFLSCEPLLGPIDLDEWLDDSRLSGDGRSYRDAPARGLGWVICGGESGPGARPMHPDWARSLRDQCAAAGAPFFFKQNGEFASCSAVEGPGAIFKFPDGGAVRRVGKVRAGRLLDGREHNAFPSPLEGEGGAPRAKLAIGAPGEGRFK